MVRPLAAVALAASLGTASGARAEVLQVSSDGECHSYDTVTRQTHVSPGECQVEAAIPVKNVKDLKALLREKTAATDFEVVDGTYIGLVETVAAAHESARLQAYALASGGYAIVSEIDMTVSVQINAPGWRKHAAPDNRWNFKNSLLSFSFRNQPVVFFTTVLDEATVAEGSNFAQRASIARVQKYLATYLETGALPDEDGVSVKINHAAVWPQIEQVANRLQLVDRIERSLARLASQLPGVQNPGLDPRDSELVQVLQAENARLTAEVSSLTERLASSETFNRALIAQLEQKSAEAEKLREALAAEEIRNAECEDLTAKQLETIAALERINRELSERYQALEQELEQERLHSQARIAELEKERVDLEKKIAGLFATIAELEKQRTEIIASYEVRLEDDARLIAKLEDTLKLVEIEREKLRVSLEVSQLENEKLTQELEAERKKLEEVIAKYKMMLEEEAKRIAELESKIQALEVERALLKQELERASEDIADLQLELEMTSMEKEKLEAFVAKLEQEIAQRQQELVATKEILGVTMEERDQAIAERDILGATLEDTDKALAALQEQHATLQDKADRYVAQVAEVLDVSCDRLEEKEKKQEEYERENQLVELETLERDVEDTGEHEGQLEIRLLVQEEEPEPTSTLFGADANELRDSLDLEDFEDLATCDADTLAPLTLEAMREKITQLVSLQAEFAQSREQVLELTGDLAEARSEPPWGMIKAVDEAVRAKELIDASYLEGARFDVIVNKLYERIANVGAALECLTTKTELVAQLEDVRISASQAVSDAQAAECVTNRAALVANALERVAFINKSVRSVSLEEQYPSPQDYVVAYCPHGVINPDSCWCSEVSSGRTVSAGMACLDSDWKVLHD